MQVLKKESLNRYLVVSWIFLRIFVVFITIYLVREQIFDLLGKIVDVYDLTIAAIKVVGTPLARVLVFAAIVGVMLFAMLLTRAFKPLTRYLSVLALASATVAALYAVPQPSVTKAVLFVSAISLLALNLAADMLPKFAQRFGPQVDLAIKWIPGTEFLFANRCVHLLAITFGKRLATFSLRSPYREVPAFLVFAVFVAATTTSPLMVALEQALRLDKGVKVLAGADIAELAISSDGRYLIASGHGLPNLLRYDLRDVSLPPRPSSELTDGAQSFFYQRDINQASIVQNNVVKSFDVESMKLAASVALPERMASGDARLAIDSRSHVIAVVSEADRPDGAYMLVMDQASGAAVARENHDAGNILLHPGKSILYLSFFQRGEAVYAYDLALRKVVARYATPYRASRMAFDRKSNELLVCFPLQGEILRLDADTLAEKGSYKVMSGVRAIGIDETRGVLMAGSLLTGTVALYEMATGNELHSWYLAPWVRYVELNPSTGMAYVSTNGALLTFDYAQYAKP